jgi:hypothetical protein
MNTRMKWSVLPVALLMMGTLATAQSQTPAAQGSSPSANSTSSTTPDPSAGQRKENQQDRIANGVQSGQLTAGEPSHPESKEEAIYGETKADGAAGNNSMLIATTGVNQAIDDLSRAFANRDLNALKQLWPSIPGRPYAALEKSFSYFKSASRNFRTENIDFNGETATVVGSYSGSFVNGTRIIPSSGRFHATLIKVGMRWIVATLVCD